MAVSGASRHCGESVEAGDSCAAIGLRRAMHGAVSVLLRIEGPAARTPFAANDIPGHIDLLQPALARLAILLMSGMIGMPGAAKPLDDRLEHVGTGLGPRSEDFECLA